MKAKLVVVAGRANRQEIPLKLPLTVGRAKNQRLAIMHPMVSRQHCEIFERDGWLCVRDLKSSNGTFVGEQRVEEAVLKPGDRLTIGPLVFEAVYQAAVDKPAKNGQRDRSFAEPAAAAPPANMVDLDDALNDESLGLDDFADDLLAAPDEHAIKTIAPQTASSDDDALFGTDADLAIELDDELSLADSDFAADLNVGESTAVAEEPAGADVGGASELDDLDLALDAESEFDLNLDDDLGSSISGIGEAQAASLEPALASEPNDSIDELSIEDELSLDDLDDSASEPLAASLEPAAEEDLGLGLDDDLGLELELENKIEAELPAETAADDELGLALEDSLGDDLLEMSSDAPDLPSIEEPPQSDVVVDDWLSSPVEEEQAANSLEALHEPPAVDADMPLEAETPDELDELDLGIAEDDSLPPLDEQGGDLQDMAVETDELQLGQVIPTSDEDLAATTDTAEPVEELPGVAAGALNEFGLEEDFELDASEQPPSFDLDQDADSSLVLSLETDDADEVASAANDDLHDISSQEDLLSDSAEESEQESFDLGEPDQELATAPEDELLLELDQDAAAQDDDELGLSLDSPIEAIEAVEAVEAVEAASAELESLEEEMSAESDDDDLLDFGESSADEQGADTGPRLALYSGESEEEAESAKIDDVMPIGEIDEELQLEAASDDENDDVLSALGLDDELPAAEADSAGDFAELSEDDASGEMQLTGDAEPIEELVLEEDNANELSEPLALDDADSELVLDEQWPAVSDEDAPFDDEESPPSAVASDAVPAKKKRSLFGFLSLGKKRKQQEGLAAAESEAAHDEAPLIDAAEAEEPLMAEFVEELAPAEGNLHEDDLELVLSDEPSMELLDDSAGDFPPFELDSDPGVGSTDEVDQFEPVMLVDDLDSQPPETLDAPAETAAEEVAAKKRSWSLFGWGKKKDRPPKVKQEKAKKEKKKKSAKGAAEIDPPAEAESLDESPLAAEEELLLEESSELEMEELVLEDDADSVALNGLESDEQPDDQREAQSANKRGRGLSDAELDDFLQDL